MKNQPKPQPEVVWREEREALTLEGEPVLEYRLRWPEITGGGPGGRWITKYYARLSKTWELRWRREVYWLACLDLAARRAASRPFTPWSGQLTGDVTLNQDGLLSLRLDGQEIRGDGKPNRVCWGDVWKVREGAPCPVADLLRGQRGWNKRLTAQLIRQGNERRAAGDCFLDPDWASHLPRRALFRDGWLTPQGLELALPQSAFAPAAEGTPIFCVPLPEPASNPNPEKEKKKIENYP